MPLASSSSFLPLVFRLICPNLGWLIAFGWHSNIKTITLGEEITRPNAYSGRNVSKQFVMIRVILLKHADKPFAADFVNPFAEASKKTSSLSPPPEFARPPHLSQC